MYRCSCCSLSNQFGDGELDMSGRYNDQNSGNHTSPPVSHMSPTIKKLTTLSASEIDDIFTRKTITVSPANDQQNSNSGLKQKKKKRKKKSTPTQLAEPKRPAPEIFLDPSAQQSYASTPKTISHDRPVPPRKKQKVVETKLDQEKFRDSRGTGPRKRIIPYNEFRPAQRPPPGRTTDEGFSIYKEDELGINAEAGGQSNPSFDGVIYIPPGTPLCPFDCDCCEYPASVLAEKK